MLSLTHVISLSLPARRLSSHLARFIRTYASIHSCVDDAFTRKSHKLPTLSRVQGHEARLPPTRCSARDRDRGTRSRSRFLRHAQWARCDTRAIIRARRLDTFNCHVNLFVPLPIEGGRALSRERARERSPRPAKNLAPSTRTTHNGPFTT